MWFWLRFIYGQDYYIDPFYCKILWLVCIRRNVANGMRIGPQGIRILAWNRIPVVLGYLLIYGKRNAYIFQCALWRRSQTHNALLLYKLKYTRLIASGSRWYIFRQSGLYMTKNCKNTLQRQFRFSVVKSFFRRSPFIWSTFKGSRNTLNSMNFCNSWVLSWTFLFLPSRIFMFFYFLAWNFHRQ